MEPIPIGLGVDLDEIDRDHLWVAGHIDGLPRPDRAGTSPRSRPGATGSESTIEHIDIDIDVDKVGFHADNGQGASSATDPIPRWTTSSTVSHRYALLIAIGPVLEELANERIPT